MIRARFYTNCEDPRPIKSPPPGPWWETGYAFDESYSVVVAYFETDDQIQQFWPDAFQVDIHERNCEPYFSERFPKPDWWQPKDEAP